MPGYPGEMPNTHSDRHTTHIVATKDEEQNKLQRPENARKLQRRAAL